MSVAAESKAVVLLSGGLDSVTVLAMALDQGYDCYALSFDYGQRHRSELNAAKQIAACYGLKEHKIIQIGLNSIGGSALTDDRIAVPEEVHEGIPVTYVPARNTIFLAYALGWAEVLDARNIIIGVNAVDYSGYPDCRPAFIESFQTLANLATKAGVEGQTIKVHTPLISMSKAEIICMGRDLGVDYGLTVSCYSADASGDACGVCESCRLRKAGFAAASVDDPTRYRI